LGKLSRINAWRGELRRFAHGTFALCALHTARLRGCALRIAYGIPTSKKLRQKVKKHVSDKTKYFYKLK
jgi:branched-subunit amino acid aminotransferase/4-amino-4-deoxychorismate lyase